MIKFVCLTIEASPFHLKLCVSFLNFLLIHSDQSRKNRNPFFISCVRENAINWMTPQNG